jgi:hypothetical protein
MVWDQTQVREIDDAERHEQQQAKEGEQLISKLHEKGAIKGV